MNWTDEIKLELARAKEAQQRGNMGKVRTSARRAVGTAVAELQRRFPDKQYGRDFISQLRLLAQDGTVPENVRNAADRLQARLSPAFESPSLQPIEDAEIIIQFVLERLS